MAFSLQQSENNLHQNQKKTQFITEHDLLRQVASTMTKKQMIFQMKDKINQEVAAQSKQLMAENFNQCFSVWRAFEKFIHNQVVCKGRTVDTLIIGIFTKNQADQVVYLPNPDYLEVGRFKLQRNLDYFKSYGDGMDLTQVNNRYRENYDQVMKVLTKGSLIELSFSSLSLVTNVPKDIVRRILSDFFQALVELSRRTNKEAQITFKGSGQLNLFQNRELAFLQSVSSGNSTVTAESLRQQRDQQRSDISHIDFASAILSSGGGKAFSIKSSSQFSRQSAFTPATQISISSSVYGSAKSLNSAVQSFQKQKKTHRRLSVPQQINTISRGQYPSSENNKTLYPHLQAFIDRGMGKRPGKRIIFDHNDYEDIVGGLQEQIKRKREAQFNDQVENTNFYHKELSERQGKILEDQKNLAIDKMLKKNAFIEANQVLVDKKIEIRINETDQEKNQKLDFFPFTHGDLIENQRKFLTELQLQEIQSAMQEKQALKDRQRRQSQLNQQINMQLLKGNSFPQKIAQKINEDIELDKEEDQVKQVSKLLSDGQSIKAKAIEEAILRHKKYLQNLAEEKKMQQAQMLWKFEAEAEVEAAQKSEKIDRTNQLVSYLQHQMKESDQLKRQQKEQTILQNIPTSFQRSFEISNEEKLLLKQNQQRMLRIELLRQIQAAENEKLQKQLQEIQNERIFNKQVETEIETLIQEEMESKQAEKVLFTRTWDTQISLQEGRKKVEDLF